MPLWVESSQLTFQHWDLGGSKGEKEKQKMGNRDLENKVVALEQLECGFTHRHSACLASHPLHLKVGVCVQ